MTKGKGQSQSKALKAEKPIDCPMAHKNQPGPPPKGGVQHKGGS